MVTTTSSPTSPSRTPDISRTIDISDLYSFARFQDSHSILYIIGHGIFVCTVFL